MATRRSSTSSPEENRNPAGEARSIDLHAWLYVLREQWWLMALCILGTLALAAAYIYVTTPLYRARAVVEVEEEAQNIVNIKDVTPDSYRTDAALKSVEGAFNSDSLFLRVVKVSHLDQEDPVYKAAPGDPPLTDSELAKIMGGKTDAKLRRGSRLVDIDHDNTDPERAAKVARTIVEEYAKMYFEQRARMATMANDFLRRQAADLKEKLARSEQALQEYREKYGTVSVEDKRDMTTDFLKQLNLKLEEARSNRIKIEADLPVLRKAQTLAIDELIGLQSVSALPDVQDTLRLITAKESEFAQIKKRYLQQHPKYIQTQSELSGLRQSLEKTARKGATIALNSYKAAKESEEKLQLALQEQQKTGVALSRIAIPYDELKRQSESDAQLYNSVLSRLKETKLSEGLEKSNIRVVQDPITPKWPSKPKVKLILALAIIAGGMLALGIIILGQAFDTSLRSVDQAEQTLNLPSLAAVPEASLKGRAPGTDAPSPLVLIDKPASREAEAFRCLRTSLSLLPGGAPKSILFTSAVPGEGKSFCAANYAVSLAQQQMRTLIIDADLRRPGLGRFFFSPRDGASGLSDVLSDKSSFDSACHETTIGQLSFMPAGTRNSNPLELLAGDKFAQVVREALGKFDRVILDSAPINAVSDTLMLAEHTDAVAFVVRARKTPARALLRAIHMLDGAKAAPAGFILNRLPPRLAEYYYYDAGNYASAGVYGT